MILFSCPRCGLKLQVTEEFAGRTTTCPTCKQPLQVPTLVKTQLNIPYAEPVHGQPSSLAQAGVDPGVTLDSNGVSGGHSVREVMTRGNAGQRYVIESEIARGGMGAVLRAVDCDIRREVAVKYLLDQADPGKKVRFIEEAQVTGQLEHPNIVPIHELALDAEKRLFFSMKMVKGRSLEQVLTLLRKKEEGESEFTLGRLLNVLVSVCNALSYAHSRGVVHRDLKPANIMLGDFGEVYVMDWGLAKVQASGGRKSPDSEGVEESGDVSPPVATTVSTSREGEADLTQEGSVLGTPVYMAPEQAAGRIHDIDNRTDVYALGAILYEMLTLLPPIDRKGGFNQIVLRAACGEITEPEKRTPERTIPPELSAIAMKALALDMGKRYFRVETFRQDIERFLEGRSVSARADTVKELAWKLVKRNKGVSIAATAALVVIAVLVFIGYQANDRARLKAEDNFRSFQAEQAAKKEQARKAVPAFIKAARLSIDRREFTDALQQIDIALDTAPEHADAQLLKAQLLLVQQDYERASEALIECRKKRPDDEALRKLIWWCLRAKRDNVSTLLGLAAVFEEQRAYALADGMLQSLGTNAVDARQKLLALYKKRLDGIRMGLGAGLSLDDSGRFVFFILDTTLVDLEFLRGIPLRKIRLNTCSALRDLAPLEGMQLQEFELFESTLRDISILKDMPLSKVSLVACRSLQDLSPLRGLPLTYLSLHHSGKVQDLSPLKGMPLVELSLNGTQVEDLTPLENMPLTWLSLSGYKKVTTLEPLRRAKLTYLSLDGCSEIEDLSPLRGMPIQELNLNGASRIHDLSPLRDMPLTSLYMRGPFKGRDLSFLQGKKLTKLDVWGWYQLEDVKALENMPITWLRIDQCKNIRDLRPLKGMKLRWLQMYGCDLIRDLTFLDGMNLDFISLNPKNIDKGMEVLRGMKNLNRIGVGVDISYIPSHPAPEFWKKYDAGEFKK